MAQEKEEREKRKGEALDKHLSDIREKKRLEEMGLIEKERRMPVYMQPPMVDDGPNFFHETGNIVDLAAGKKDIDKFVKGILKIQGENKIKREEERRKFEEENAKELRRIDENNRIEEEIASKGLHSIKVDDGGRIGRYGEMFEEVGEESLKGEEKEKRAREKREKEKKKKSKRKGDRRERGIGEFFDVSGEKEKEGKEVIHFDDLQGFGDDGDDGVIYPVDDEPFGDFDDEEIDW